MVNEQVNANATVRLLINYLKTDDTTGEPPESQNSQTPATVESTPKRGGRKTPRLIQHANCRWCRQANYTEPSSHPTNSCPRYQQLHGTKPSDRGRNDGKSLVAQHMLTGDRQLPIIDT